MGYRHIEYAGERVHVHLTLEKGFWDVRISDAVVATDTRYMVLLFTYLLTGSEQPKMLFEDQLHYAKQHWSEIIDAFSPSRRIKTHVRLSAAAKKRAAKLSAIWPTAVLDLESFLKHQGFKCTYRKEPHSIYDWMAMRYADSRIAVQMDSQNGWHVKFGDVTHDPDRWYSFSSIRKFIQWPEDKELTYAQAFEFIKENWSKIVDIFKPDDSKETHERLEKIERNL